MKGWVNEWKDVKRWMNGQKGKQVDGWIFLDGCMYRWTDKRMDGRTNRWKDR